jgi:hypothetical protein
VERQNELEFPPVSSFVPLKTVGGPIQAYGIIVVLLRPSSTNGLDLLLEFCAALFLYGEVAAGALALCRSE